MDHDRTPNQEPTASSSLLPRLETETPTAFANPQHYLHEQNTNVGVGDNPSIFPNTGPHQEKSSPTSWRDDQQRPRSTQSPLPPLPETISPRGLEHLDPRAMPLNIQSRRPSMVPQTSEVDWIVPQARDDRDRGLEARPKSVGERLDPTLKTAIAEKEKYVFKARLTGFALNAAIGMQVVLGALTTGLSVVTTGKQTQVMTAILGGIATIVASYLARARGSNEPELSITRVKDLEQFIRDCEAFKLDHGHVFDGSKDDVLTEFRGRFEDLLGNANGERRLSSV